MKILICGDFTTCGKGMKAVEEETAISETVFNIIKESDMVVVNLEAPVVTNNIEGIDKVGPCLKTSPKTISYMKGCGIGCVTLANNHFYDYGEHGVSETIKTLNYYGIKHIGGGMNDKETSNPLILNHENDNCNICILNYCESEFSVDHEMGSNKLDPIKVYYDIRKATINHQFVIVIVHGGHEGYQLPSPRMKQLYRYFIDCGANVVVNHHQHCYSGYESYHKGMIFYGLGNFFFDSIFRNASKNWFEGYMIGLDIVGGRLVEYKIMPYYQCLNDVISVRLMNTESKKFFEHKISELNSIISDDEQLKIAFSRFTKSQKHLELVSLTPYSNRILQALYKRRLFPLLLSKKKKLQLLNAMRCEAHRDMCLSLLNSDLSTK